MSSVCLTFFKYSSFSDKIWAFSMMQFAHSHLGRVSGLNDYKLMGSGRGLGFNPWPDWSIYAVLTVWENKESMEKFFSDHPLYQRYEKHAQSIWSVELAPVTGHGTWSGKVPFQYDSRNEDLGEKWAVITRATIRKNKLRKFWKFVPKAQKPIGSASGLLYTKGIGEVPFINMATFSIWEDLEMIKSFAYGSEEHKEALRLTRSSGWYSEELFARFKVINETGDSAPFVKEFKDQQRAMAVITPNDR